MGKIGKVLAVSCLAVSSLVAGACASGGSAVAENQIAATVNGRNIMLQEVERQLNQQTGGNPAALNQLQLAQARLQILNSLIQREVLFQRAEREKVLPTEAQVESGIASQKQGKTQEDFEKALQTLNLSMERVREEVKKDLAIAALQDKYSGNINISNREVEDFYNANRDQFVNARGVALAMIMVDPADNSSQGISDDAKNETDAKLKIDNIYQQLQGKADFATVARAKSEDVRSVQRGGDIGFATEEVLRSTGFPADLITNLFGPMQVGDYTQPIRFADGKWYVFKLAERRLQTENVTLESPGVREQITQGLTNQRKAILNEALLEVAMNQARVVNNLAENMLNNPGNLGLRPAGSTGTQPPANSTASPTQQASPAGSPAASGPASSSSPVSVRPNASPTK